MAASESASELPWQRLRSITGLPDAVITRIAAALQDCSALYGVSRAGEKWRALGKRQNGTFINRVYPTRLEAMLVYDELHRQDQQPHLANFDTSGQRQRFKSSQTGVHWKRKLSKWRVQVQYKEGSKWHPFLDDKFFPLEQEAAAIELARRRVALLRRLRPGPVEPQPQQAAAPAASEAQLQQAARALALQGAEAQTHIAENAAELLRGLLLPVNAAGMPEAVHFGDRVAPRLPAAAAAGEDEAVAAAAAEAAAEAEAAGEAAYAEARRQAALDSDQEEEEEEEDVDHEYGGQRIAAAVRGSMVRRVANTLGACAARCLFCDGSSSGGTPCSHCGGSPPVQRALAAPGMPLQHLTMCASLQQASQYMQQQAEQQGMQGPWYSKRNDVGHILAVAHADSRLEADLVDSLPNLYPQDRPENRRKGCDDVKLAQRAGSSLEPALQRFLGLERGRGPMHWRAGTPQEEAKGRQLRAAALQEREQRVPRILRSLHRGPDWRCTCGLCALLAGMQLDELQPWQRQHVLHYTVRSFWMHFLRRAAVCYLVADVLASARFLKSGSATGSSQCRIPLLPPLQMLGDCAPEQGLQAGKVNWPFALAVGFQAIEEFMDAWRVPQWHRTAMLRSLISLLIQLLRRPGEVGPPQLPEQWLQQQAAQWQEQQRRQPPPPPAPAAAPAAVEGQHGSGSSSGGSSSSGSSSGSGSDSDGGGSDSDGGSSSSLGGSAAVLAAAPAVAQRPAPPVEGSLPLLAPDGSSIALRHLWALAAYAEASCHPAVLCLAAADRLQLLWPGGASGPAAAEEQQALALEVRLRRLCRRQGVKLREVEVQLIAEGASLRPSEAQLSAEGARSCLAAALEWQRVQRPPRFLPAAVKRAAGGQQQQQPPQQQQQPRQGERRRERRRQWRERRRQRQQQKQQQKQQRRQQKQQQQEAAAAEGQQASFNGSLGGSAAVRAAPPAAAQRPVAAQKKRRAEEQQGPRQKQRRTEEQQGRWQKQLREE